MICKITRCANLPVILGYNFAKQSRNVAYIIDSQFMPHLDKTDPAECMRIIETWGSRNATCEKRFVHINVNPAPQDWRSGKMTEELLVQVCREYLEAMGFGDQPYVTLIHKDKAHDRWHAHIVTTCIKIDGDRIGDSNEHRRSMSVVRELEQKYGLWNATVKREVKAEEIGRVKYDSGEVKRKISDLVEYARSFRYDSFEQFKAILNVYGVSVKMVQRFQGGKMRTGLVYFCIDSHGKQVGRCFRANQLHQCGIKDTLAHISTVYIPRDLPGWLDGIVKCPDKEKAEYLLRQSGVVPIVCSHGITCLVDIRNKEVYEVSDYYRFAHVLAGREYNGFNLGDNDMAEELFEEICDFVNEVIGCFMVGSIAVVDSETPEQKKRRKRRMGR